MPGTGMVTPIAAKPIAVLRQHVDVRIPRRERSCRCARARRCRRRRPTNACSARGDLQADAAGRPLLHRRRHGIPRIDEARPRRVRQAGAPALAFERRHDAARMRPQGPHDRVGLRRLRVGDEKAHGRADQSIAAAPAAPAAPPGTASGRASRAGAGARRRAGRARRCVRARAGRCRDGPDVAGGGTRCGTATVPSLISALVGQAVRIREMTHGRRRPPAPAVGRCHDLVVERRGVERSQAGMRPRVRSDRHAAAASPAARGVEQRHRRHPCRLPGPPVVEPDAPGDDVHRRRDAQALEHRHCRCRDTGVAVVEVSPHGAIRQRESSGEPVGAGVE